MELYIKTATLFVTDVHLSYYIADYPFIFTTFFRFVGTVSALDVPVASLISADAVSIGALELVSRAS